MKKLDFFDGAQSETTPTIGNIEASSLVQYDSDAAYEANEQGAPTEGNVYYNTTENVVRYYNGTAWMTIVDEVTPQSLNNKNINANLNTISNIGDDEIQNTAGIQATKIADGSVTNTEFQYINSVTSNVQDQLDAKINSSEKGAVNGVATLNGSGLVPASQLPSYVDDVLEYADFTSFPATGETGKLYVALDTNFLYRWSGSVYVNITSKADSQENVALVGKGSASWSVSAGFSNVNSVNFDGTNDRGVIGANAALNMSSYSAWSTSLWFKTTTSAGSGLFGCWEYGATQRQWLVYILNGQIYFFGSSNGSTSVSAVTPSTYNDGNWHQVVCVYQGAGSPGLVYVDGTLAVTGTNFPTLLNVTNPVVAGCTSDGAPTEFLNGNLDEIALWDKALTGPEITELYNSGTVINLATHSASANNIGWWRMGDGDTFPTISDNVSTNDMTLTNMDAGDIVTDAVSGAGGSSTLTLDTDSFLSVPPLADDRHTIPAQSVPISDGQCAYVTIDRQATVATNLTVTVDDITNVAPDGDKVIIARNAGDECYVGLHDPQRITDGQTISLQTTPETSAIGYEEKNTSYSLTSSDDTIGFNTGASDLTATLPDATASPVGLELTIKKIDSGTGHVAVDGFGGQDIDSRAIYYLYKKDNFITVKNTGIQWKIVSRDVSDYREIVINSRPQTTTQNNYVSATELLTLPPGRWIVGYNVLLRINNGGGSLAGIVGTARIYNNTTSSAVADTSSAIYHQLDAGKEHASMNGNQVEISVTTERDFTIQVAFSGTGGAVILEDSEFTAGITGNDNTSKMYAQRVD